MDVPTPVEDSSSDEDSFSDDHSTDSWARQWESGNIDAIEDFFGEDDVDSQSYWMADDQVAELYQRTNDNGVKVPPPLMDWNLQEPQDKPMQVTFGKARRSLWLQFKQEHALFMNNVKKLSTVQDVTGSINKVYQYLFGPKSSMAKIFYERIGISEEVYVLFMITYLKSCCYRMSVKNINNNGDPILMMPTKEYNAIWKTIAGLERNASGESFWQELEDDLNTSLMALFMGGNDEETIAIRSSLVWLLGLDDDKLHSAWTHSTEFDGLKKDHHQKDNRHGFTAHTCCLSATCVPIQVQFQRESETVVSCTNRMVSGLFGRHTGRPERIDNTTFFMDRGYWNARVFFDLLDKGADVHGTIKRMDWVPLTYTKLKKEDSESDSTFPQSPLKIPMVGFKDSYHMSLKWKGSKSAVRKVDMFGYRSGSGSAVSIIASSVFRKDHFDFVPVDERDQVWYHNKELSFFERRKHGMSLLAGEQDDSHVRTLLEEMEPRTCTQGTADWFADRQMSGTSSTIWELVDKVAPLVDAETADESVVDAFATVLEYAGAKADYLGSVFRKQAAAAAETTTAGVADESADEPESKKQAAGWIKSLTDPAIDMDEDFESECLRAAAMSDPFTLDMLRWMLALLKRSEKKGATAKSIADFFAKWLKHEKRRRTFEPLPVAVLKKILVDSGAKSSGQKKDLIDELVKPSDRRTKQSKAQEKKRRQADMDPTLSPLVALFKQSFLRPQSDAPKEAAAIGHRNEEPFLKAFYKECANSTDSNETPFSFSKLSPEAIYRVGLMRKKGSKFAKASLDAVAFLDDGSMLPVEVKSRVSQQTMHEAADKIEDMVGAELYSKRKKYLVSLSSGDSLLRDLLHDSGTTKREYKEAFQLLHGAYVSGSSRGLMLVGSRDELMLGIDVAFEETLLEAYSLVIEYMYDTYFAPFYECFVKDLIETKYADIKKALEFVPDVDEHSFWTNYMLWRALNVDVNEFNVCFPLPPSARCIPYQNAYWNAMKGLYSW